MARSLSVIRLAIALAVALAVVLAVAAGGREVKRVLVVYSIVSHINMPLLSVICLVYYPCCASILPGV
jgi:ABC-type arginine/histidine transport system permease subunit